MDSDKAKKRFENITGLPVTSDKYNGRRRTFTSTINSNKPLWESKDTSKRKEISSDFAEKKKDEELKRKKEIEEIDKERSRRKKNWKTYTHSEKWTEPEGNVDVEVKTTATGDFESEKLENSSAEITELTEEEAGKLENEGVEVKKASSEKKIDIDNKKKEHSLADSENSHEHRNKWGTKSPYVVGGLSLLGLIVVVIAVAKGS